MRQGGKFGKCVSEGGVMEMTRREFMKGGLAAFEIPNDQLPAGKKLRKEADNRRLAAQLARHEGKINLDYF